MQIDRTAILNVLLNRRFDMKPQACANPSVFPSPDMMMVQFLDRIMTVAEIAVIFPTPNIAEMDKLMWNSLGYMMDRKEFGMSEPDLTGFYTAGDEENRFGLLVDSEGRVEFLVENKNERLFFQHRSQMPVINIEAYNRFALGLIGMTRTLGLAAYRFYEKNKIVRTVFNAVLLQNEKLLIGKGTISALSEGLIDIPPCVGLDDLARS